MPRAAKSRDDRGGIARPVSLPGPFLRPGVAIERHNRSVLVAADVGDDELAVDDGRHRGAELGRGLWELLLGVITPRDLSRDSIDRAQDPADTERVDAAAVYHRGRFRTLAVTRRGRRHGV